MKKQKINKLFSVTIFVTLLVALAQTAGAMPHGGSPDTPAPVPDAGSVSFAMALACSCMAAVRKFIR